MHRNIYSTDYGVMTKAEGIQRFQTLNLPCSPRPGSDLLSQLPPELPSFLLLRHGAL